MRREGMAAEVAAVFIHCSKSIFKFRQDSAYICIIFSYLILVYDILLSLYFCHDLSLAVE